MHHHYVLKTYLVKVYPVFLQISPILRESHTQLLDVNASLCGFLTFNSNIYFEWD